MRASSLLAVLPFLPSITGGKPDPYGLGGDGNAALAAIANARLRGRRGRWRPHRRSPTDIPSPVTDQVHFRKPRDATGRDTADKRLKTYRRATGSDRLPKLTGHAARQPTATWLTTLGDESLVSTRRAPLPCGRDDTTRSSSSAASRAPMPRAYPRMSGSAVEPRRQAPSCSSSTRSTCSGAGGTAGSRDAGSTGGSCAATTARAPTPGAATHRRRAVIDARAAALASSRTSRRARPALPDDAMSGAGSR